MDRSTQKSRIVAFCKKNGSITVRDMYAMGINSPTMRIAEMNADPAFKVDKERIVKTDDDGKMLTHYTRYYVQEVPNA